MLNVKGGPYYTYLTENKKILEQLSKEFFGRQIPIKIKADENNTTSAKSKEDDKIIKDAVKTFGGRIVEERRSRLT